MNVVVCPHPPLLVPGLDPHGLPEIADVRSHALAAVGGLVDAGYDVVTVIGDEADVGDEQSGGSLAGHGVDVRAGGPDTGLGLASTIGAWLLDSAGWTGGRRFVAPYDRDAIAAADALLVMADGTARRSLRAPGHLDPRAAVFDDAVATALGGGDAAALAALDLDLADELMMAGGPALTAMGRVVADRVAAGAEVQARLRLHDAPFGVGYWVADWQVG